MRKLTQWSQCTFILISLAKKRSDSGNAAVSAARLPGAQHGGLHARSELQSARTAKISPVTAHVLPPLSSVLGTYLPRSEWKKGQYLLLCLKFPIYLSQNNQIIGFTQRWTEEAELL